MIEWEEINDLEDINSKTSTVLIDSIDEAISEAISEKKVKKRLVKYIKSCQKINSEIKFIITCRFLEWKEVFESELKNIDDSLKVLEIKDLSEKDINKIIDFKEKDKKEFWGFIEKNSLSMLLKNILIVENIVLNYEIYKKENLKYADIYKKIIKDHIFIETDNIRKEIIQDYSGEKLEKISSSISCYMILNRMNLLPKINLSILASEIYKLEGYEIVGKDLDVLFDTSLFIGESKSLKFIHKSIQEHSTARFIIDKGLSIEKIKEIFGYNSGFYERFEEVIIHLTNIEPQFFRYFVDFDPFIFRRHPNLNEEEQKQLFIAIIKKLKTDGQELWGNWKNVRGTTLVKFDKVNDLFKYLGENIEINQVNRELFLYLEKILDENYSEELDGFLLEVLEYRNKNKQEINEYLNSSWNENKNYNKKLIEFIKRNELLNINHESLYVRIFKMLYKYIELKDLKILMKYISEYRKIEAIEVLDRNDIKEWIEDTVKNYENESDKILELLIYNFLSEYNKNEKQTLEKILKFVSRENRFHIFTDYYNEKKLNFNLIESDFFDYYFKPLEEKEYPSSRNKILTFYSIEFENIQKISKKYPIKDYKEYYKNLTFNEEIRTFLLTDNNYKIWIEEMNKKVEKLSERRLKVLEEEERRKKSRQEREKEYIKAIDSLSNIEEAYFIFKICFEKYRGRKEKIKEKLVNDLGEKYPEFLMIVRDYFRADILYLKLEERLLDSSFYTKSCLYDYMFLNLGNFEIETLINNEKEYEKLFWHLFSSSKLNNSYFFEISKKYKNKLLKISLEIFKLSMEKSNKTISKIGCSLIELYEKLNLYNSNDLEKLIFNMKEELKDNYKTIVKKSKEDMLKLISLNYKNYQFIKGICKKDIENRNIYLKYLILIDINQGIDDFIKIKCKNSIKKKEFEELVLLIYSLNENQNFYFTMKLSDDKIEILLEQYFKLCEDYNSKGFNNYSQVEHKVYGLVYRELLPYLGENLDKIGVLKKLSKSKNEELVKLSKYYLKELENLRIENGVYPPQYYKKLFDNYKPKEKIFFDYEKLDKDFREISYELMESRKSISQEKEDLINDRFRSALRFKGYNVLDQSRGGESESSKSLGERDLIIKNKETQITECLIEAFILKNMAKGIIKNHYQKLIKKYDVHGNKKNIILVYVKTKHFDNLWGKYSLHFSNLEKLENEKENLKIGVTKEGNMEVIHYFINFYSE